MSDLYVVVGLGATGYSCARYLKAQGYPVAVTDSRLDPPFLAPLQKDYPDLPIALGELSASLLAKASCIVLSPGLALSHPSIAPHVKRVPVIGDIELFAKIVKVPVVGITGTNAKSTVTTLLGKMAEASGLRTAVGGNLGIPALDLIAHNPKTNLFVLELSSFQLETTHSLHLQAATVLNITPDHMDRYADLTEYQQAKLRIYDHCEVAVSNLDDPLTDCQHALWKRKFSFTLQSPQKDQFGLLEKEGKIYLAFETTPLLSVHELPIKGRHYQANALAALAIGYGVGLPFEAMLKVLREFKGLPHRCQFVRKRQEVTWYNDSKGTNVGATLAAIEGLGSELSGKLVLIAGGVGKHADFRPLVPAIKKYSRHVVLMGEASHELAQVIGSDIPISFAASMEEAVTQAAKEALPEDSVLLSPACASFDMFNNYEHRGDVFTEIVKNLN